MSTDVNMSIHNSTIQNLERGVLERVFFVKNDEGKYIAPPKPVEDIFRIRLGYFADLLLPHLPPTSEYSYDEFVETYSGRKKTVYTNAVKSLRVKPLNDRDSTLTVFLKAEKTNLSAKPDPPARIISPRNPRYNVEVGCYLKKMEHALYKGIKNVFGETTISKGLNSQQVGHLLETKWNRYSDPVAVGLDAVRFDQHISKAALEFEHNIYNRYWKCPKLRKLLLAQLNNRCFGTVLDGKLKYKTVGGRMSGDMNTGMGNCLIMCAMIHAYMKSLGVRKYSLINNGDDCVVIFEKRFLTRFSASLGRWFLAMGFNIKAEEPVYVLEQIEFCQTKPVWTPEGYIMVRNPKTAIAKDCISVKPLDNHKTYERWVSSVGQCGMSLTGGIPIFQNFYLSLTKAGRGRKIIENETTMEGGLYIMSKGMKREKQVVHSRTRFSFYLAFGILPDLQECIEEYYDQVTPYFNKTEASRLPDCPVWWI